MHILLTQHCEEADEFLELLSPTGKIFGRTEAIGSREHLGDAWVFRGHSHDEYSLIPTAIRSGEAFKKFGGNRCDDQESQIREEIKILRRFFNLADANGLALPEDSQTLRANIQDLSSNDYFQQLNTGAAIWPPPEIWSLLGIAQHYGIPTRLLDWTRKAQVAAYFAASGAARYFHQAKDNGQLIDKNLSVWAFAFDRFTSHFDKEDAAMFSEKPPASSPVVKITAPRAGNPNLHAQSGLFSLRLEDFKGKVRNEVKRIPLESFIENFMTEHDMQNIGVLFHRITLPLSEASLLLWRLQQCGIGNSTIYPGYQGVVGALLEESAYW